MENALLLLLLADSHGTLYYKYNSTLHGYGPESQIHSGMHSCMVHHLIFLHYGLGLQNTSTMSTLHVRCETRSRVLFQFSGSFNYHHHVRSAFCLCNHSKIFAYFPNLESLCIVRKNATHCRLQLSFVSLSLFSPVSLLFRLSSRPRCRYSCMHVSLLFCNIDQCHNQAS
jgi:hypothetical protein